MPSEEHVPGTRRIERNSPALDRIVSPDAEIKELASGGVFNDLGGGGTTLYARSLEGPFWVQEGGYLLFSDIGSNRRMKWAHGQGVAVFQKPTNHANGATRDQQGRIVSCEHSSRQVTRLEPDGRITVLANSYEGKRLNRPNDVVVKSDGSIYFTDPWWNGGALDNQELDFTGVYRISPDLQTVTLLVRDFVTPNGLAFSPDERVLYINDSRRKHIRTFDVLPDGTLNLASDRVFRDLGGDRPGSPDGMKIDVEGNVYCGGSGGLWVMDPTGKHLGIIVHGGGQTNNLAWGGGDWKTLFFVSWVALGCIQMKIPGIPVPRGSLR